MATARGCHWKGKQIEENFEAKKRQVQSMQERIQYFGQGAQRNFDPKGGGLSPKFAQNRGFLLNLPENCKNKKKNLGGKGGRASLDPSLAFLGT